MMTPPCSACKYLKRKCTENCVFAPYFPANKYAKYEAVHKVFGASHVAILLNNIDPNQREEAMDSLTFEAEARLHDPIYGCSRFIYLLQRQLQYIQTDLAIAKTELASYNITVPTFVPPPPITYQQNYHNIDNNDHLTPQQLPEAFQRYAFRQDALMQETSETQTQQNQREMNARDKNISSKM